MGVELGIGDGTDGRRRNVAVAIEVEEAPAVDIGVVRMGEGDLQEERLVTPIAGPVEDLAVGEEGDFVVIFELVGDLGGTGLLHRGHVVIPPVDPLAATQPPIGRPAEIGRVDVGGEALLETVQLVGADGVQLAGKAGAVALEARNNGRRSGSRPRTRRHCRRRRSATAAAPTAPPRAPARRAANSNRNSRTPRPRRRAGRGSAP